MRLDGGFDLAPPLVLRPQVANMRSRWSAQVCLSAFAEIALDERVRPDIVRDASQPDGSASVELQIGMVPQPAESRNRLVSSPSFWLLRRRLDLSHDERLLA